MKNLRLRNLTIFAAVVYGLAATPGWAQQYTASPFAGGVWPTLPAAGNTVSVGSPLAVAPDGHGNVYFTSQGMDAVFKVDTSGVVTMVAGGWTTSNAPANGHALSDPSGVAVDSAGNLYVVDSNIIYKIDTGGTMTTVYSVGLNEWLPSPASLAVDGTGNLYFPDIHGRVLKANSQGAVTFVAGGGNLMGSAVNGNPGTHAYLSRPTGVALDGAGNLYIADAGLHYVYEVNPGGSITLVAGNGSLTLTPDGGAATSAGICPEGGLGADAAGDIYIPDVLTNSVRKVNTQGILTTVAGTLAPGFGGDGGPATSALLSGPMDAAPDAQGSLWIADASNFRVRLVNAAGDITTAAGISGWNYGGDGGEATSAQMTASGAAVDAMGDVFIADVSNARVREVNTGGTISTVAGDGTQGAGVNGGSALGASLYSPSSVAVDSNGNLYIGDSGLRMVWKVDTQGDISPVVATIQSAYVAVDAAGNLYVADGSQTVRKVDTNGGVTTVAGNGKPGFSGDTQLATSAQLQNPSGIALDSAGNLYIADTSNARVRKVDLTGIITTVAGNGTWGVPVNGSVATSSPLGYPNGVAVDSFGNLLIADGEVHRVDKTGIITNIPSDSDPDYWIAAGPGGTLYVAGGANSVVDVLTPVLPDLTLTATHSGNFTQGQTGAVYTVTVSNGGAGETSGTVTLADTLPSALAATAMSGPGWGCTLSTLTCTRSDTLAGAASYPAITITVNVPSNAPASVTNTATVSGGGETNTGNDKALDPTTIGAGAADLTVTKTHSGSFMQGQAAAAYTITVSNAGAGATNGAVTLVEHVAERAYCDGDERDGLELHRERPHLYAKRRVGGRRELPGHNAVRERRGGCSGERDEHGHGFRGRGNQHRQRYGSRCDDDYGHSPGLQLYHQSNQRELRGSGRFANRHRDDCGGLPLDGLEPAQLGNPGSPPRRRSRQWHGGLDCGPEYGQRTLGLCDYRRSFLLRSAGGGHRPNRRRLVRARSALPHRGYAHGGRGFRRPIHDGRFDPLLRRPPERLRHPQHGTGILAERDGGAGGAALVPYFVAHGPEPASCLHTECRAGRRGGQRSHRARRQGRSG